MPENLENKIILGDCLEVMRGIPDKAIDLVLTDPPYGLNMANQFAKDAGKIKGSKTGFCQAARTEFKGGDWDKETPGAEYFAEIFRISKNQIIFGGNYFTEHLPPSSCWLVWDKHTNGHFADCELAFTSFSTAVRKFDFTWNGLLQQDMKNKERRIHPTQKPRQLFEMILAKYSEPGALVLDPFAGSGTLALAAHNTGRRFICIERDEDYHRGAVERFGAHTSQGALMLEPPHLPEA